MRRLADDEVVGNLLVLHDLHPDDVDTRVQQALERVRPYLGSHAGGVSLSGVDERGVVHLRLEGSCDGCPSSSLTVRSAIEDAILRGRARRRGRRGRGDGRDRAVAAADRAVRDRTTSRTRRAGGGHVDLDVPPRTMTAVDVAGRPVLVANLDGTLVAYLDRCPACLAPLSEGALAGDRVTCPSGGTRTTPGWPGGPGWRRRARSPRCRCCPSVGPGRCRCPRR